MRPEVSGCVRPGSGYGFGTVLELGAVALSSPYINSARWRRRHLSAGAAVARSASISSSYPRQRDGEREEGSVLPRFT